MRSFVGAIGFLAGLAVTASAENGYIRFPSSHSNRIHVYSHDADSSGIRIWRFDSPTPSDFGKHFPYGPGGITAGITNPTPRKPSDMPVCYYDASGTLFYERQGSVCPYKRLSANDTRVERRRQQWLRSH